MILSIITMNVLPEKQKELIQTILSMNKALEKEAGCMSCSMFCNIQDKNNFNLFKEWQTRKDLHKYLKSEMFGILLGTNSLLCEPFKIKIYTVSNSEGIETVNSARNTVHPPAIST
ncbi:Antibiotic biosynthesis monooxygenase domain-containing protein [Desulfonema limicola]|uniref:Antibiotic biosynthesis monooxygenase domain-containing protein n=1 Tax=Desulfonema limicola TaxID=45656 RepID=A0A975BAJ0_9BACT|nr:antibiotic biosynthesis monooxygenase family protein [Desulfonema limicola]QTA81848.1 Antibiotic biosynthesis monooxygenase domain-containing protein [Desulfonema limicola]